MPSPAPIPPAIDYTNKDYTSFRNAMLSLAAYRLPEWTDLSEADPGVLLVELFAYVGDVLAYYQDRLASESFLTTATEPRNILNLLRLIGYQLNPPVASHAELQLTFNAPQAGQSSIVTVPQGTQFATKPPSGTPSIPFEYQGPDLKIDLAYGDHKGHSDRHHRDDGSLAHDVQKVVRGQKAGIAQRDREKYEKYQKPEINNKIPCIELANTSHHRLTGSGTR